MADSRIQRCRRRWLTGGFLALLGGVCASPVSASVLEKLVMPGPVASAHEEIEDDCSRCHTKSSGIPEQKLCVTCHQRVGSDVESGTGYHGRHERARTENCSACHTDHEGRDASMIVFSARGFNHQLTDFVLEGAHRPLSCESCHAADLVYAEAPGECIGCHQQDDRHRGQLGPACADCHSQSEWTGAGFDHDLTGFLLTGAHARASCDSCHQSPVFADATDRCVGCHRADDVHKGGNGENCQQCHTTVNWNDLKFDHLGLTGFGLTGGHDNLTCAACHKGDDFAAERGALCQSCHAPDDVHRGNLGGDCGSCHQVSGWSDTGFDHDLVGDFPLRGAHVSLACTSCHAGPVSESIDSECGSCHEDDDTHIGQLGPRCSDCHGEDSWAAAIRFDHGLTGFPLLGQHQDAVCASCHESDAFHDAPESCVDCHRADDVHDDSMGGGCETCHNPAAWNAVVFDHESETGFSLTGRHRKLGCSDCHREPVADGADLPRVCGQCHRRDDRHDGRFGPDCGSCHSTKSFTRVSEL